MGLSKQPLLSLGERYASFLLILDESRSYTSSRLYILLSRQSLGLWRGQRRHIDISIHLLTDLRVTYKKAELEH